LRFALEDVEQAVAALFPSTCRASSRRSRPRARPVPAARRRCTRSAPTSYLYDFGDDWQHVIKLERWFENVDTAGMPFLLEASGRCPPEDVGGPEGYATFLVAIADAAHPEHADALQWAPAGFDPAKVNQADLEGQVDALAQNWRPRPRK
jgi:hypothetical protein